MSGLRVGVVGATGAVGKEMVAVLAERRFPLGSLRMFASARSCGASVPFRGQAVKVEECTEAGLQDLDLVLMSAGQGPAREFAPGIVRRGGIVVDNSSAFRGDPDVPLVVPEVNGDALRSHRGLIANPNCTTIIHSLVAAPLHREFGLRRAVVSSYQAASGAGARGTDELFAGVRNWVHGLPHSSTVFPAPLAFNVIPQIGEVGPGGETDEEAKLERESRRLLDVPDLSVLATCVRVPTERAHGVSSVLWFHRCPILDRVRGVLEGAPGVRVVTLPTPREAAGQDEVLVGRLRVTPWDGGVVGFFAVGDQVRKGAALNAVQIAECLTAS